MNDKNYSIDYYGLDCNSVIEVAEREKGAADRLVDVYNRVIFVLQGDISYHLNFGPEKFAKGGQIFFIPSMERWSYCILRHSRILVFKLKGPANLYATCYLQSICTKKSQKNEIITVAGQDSCLQINTSLHHFAEGIIICMQDGIQCDCWYEMKIRELFILLKSYYPGHETEAFLRKAANTNTEFLEHVLKYWKDCRSVEQLAASMNMTVKQFSTRFAPIFGLTPGKWMIREKARIVHREIAYTAKPFKQIAFENGFTSDSLFTRFCKSELGKTPSDLRMKKK